MLLACSRLMLFRSVACSASEVGGVGIADAAFSAAGGAKGTEGATAAVVADVVIPGGSAEGDAVVSRKCGPDGVPGAAEAGTSASSANTAARASANTAP